MSERRDDLVREKENWIARLTAINTSLRSAAAAARRGQYMAPGAFASLHSERKHAAREVWRIDAELSKMIPRGLRALVPNEFLSVCRLRLDPSLFKRLHDEAFANAVRRANEEKPSAGTKP